MRPIPNGKRSHIMRLWNEHHNVERVARLLNVPIEDAERYIATKVRNVREARREDKLFGKYGPEPKVTLPRLKFLGGTDGL